MAEYSRLYFRVRRDARKRDQELLLTFIPHRAGLEFLRAELSESQQLAIESNGRAGR